MSKLFDAFPFLQDKVISIGKMQVSDTDDLMEITGNENIYRFIPHFLYKKSRGNIIAAIRNMGERDFNKHKEIIAGIYLNSNRKLIGLFEVFDHKKRSGTVTIGYRINENYWNQGIATKACGMMVAYLSKMEDVHNLVAYVMPDNIFSAKVLLKNGFEKMHYTKEDHNWGQCENVTLDVYQFTVRN